MEIRHVVVFLLVTCSGVCHVSGSRLSNPFDSLNKAMDVYKRRVEDMKSSIVGLARQVMLQQFFAEERIRSDGDSGVKSVRGGPRGLKNYDAPSHVSSAVLAIHDHSNYDRTMGMGEFTAVLNGLEFRTRHNDYKVVRPSTVSGEYDATENIEYPQPPPEVTDLPTVQEQILEMREWYRAYWSQNATHRDYKKYFRPVIAYMEGGWTLDEKISESFESDRHSLDAASWFELQEKNRFASASGSKDQFENVAYLPTTILEVNETSGIPTYAQWNYRILCKEIEGDIPFEYLQQVEDLSSRVSRGWTLSEVRERRSARFKLYRGTIPEDYGLIDEIMYTIPGKDNFYNNLTQAVFDDTVMFDMAFLDKNVKLDTGRYHRWYKTEEADAMGLSSAARCFNDENCWVAQTTQPRIASLEIEHCGRKYEGAPTTCEMVRNAFTYAIPLEIIFLHPLLTWNPYGLDVHEGLGIATANDEKGSESEPYNGVDSDHYYMTPVEFYAGDLNSGSPADTVKSYVYVRGPDGTKYKTTASGHKIMLPEIEGIGMVRTRFPIAPVHGEGSAVWKELNALSDTVTGNMDGPPRMVYFEMSSNGDHYHDFAISYIDFISMTNDLLPLTLWTNEAAGHRHKLEIKYYKSDQEFEYRLCDGYDKCMDDHPRLLKMTTINVYTELPN